MLLRDLRLWLRLSCRLRIVLTVVFCWFTAAAPLWAGGPRWVAGHPLFTTEAPVLDLRTAASEPVTCLDPGL